jgi:hypothetical protein
VTGWRWAVWRHGPGHHRSHRPPPAPAGPAPPKAERVLAEAAAGDLTVDELRWWLHRVDDAAAAAGTDPGRLRLWAAVRPSGAVKAVSVTIRRPGGA